MQINITNDKKRITVTKSDSILDILQENGVYIDAPCNKSGKCGKCKVIVTGELNALTTTEKKILTDKEISQNIRLACMTTPIGDCDVTIIGDSGYEVMTLGTTSTFLVDDDFVDKTDVGMAVDIGTTTVVCYFYELASGKKLYTASGLNEQRSFGADVISRIESCMANENGKTLLQDAIVFELNGFINDFCVESNIDIERIKRGLITGNTVMLHLLCMLDASKIAVAPFVPTSLFGNEIKADAIGIKMAKDATIYLADSIASYVGGDITTGLLSCDADMLEKPCLFLDIGTNGEMALGDKNGFICCATAAGPAFEGAHIKYGVGGISGAIDSVSLTKEGDSINITTIANKPPIGICGSGLIDAIASLLSLNIIDETGRLDEVPGPYAKHYKDDEFILDFESGITITQKDIREVQLAKAAIAAGMNTMLHYKGLSIDDIDRVILAGGFGSYISKKSACAIGLLPKNCIDKVDTIGNAAGMGAIKALLSKDACARLKTLASSLEYFELSGDSFFQDEYIEQMMF